MDARIIAGRYRLDRQLGASVMSEVWAADDLELDRTVAVKLLAAGADPARFEREARAAAGLSHPNVCALYDYGEDAGRRYMALEYLPGGTLESRLGGHPLPDADTRRIAQELAAGLAHAHERGLVHRDLKPANVLFDSHGRAKIADFGIARAEAATALTEAGTVLGTAAYISPEQAAGLPATAASDVYAFGVILFRMLTGRLPFESADGIALATMHRDLPPPAVADLRPDAPPALESLAAACLAKRPGDRPADGRALLGELPPATDETAVTELLAPPPRRRWSAVLVVVGAALLAAAGIGLAVSMGSDGGTPPATSASSSTVSTTSPAPTTAPAPAPPPTAEATTDEATTAETTTAPATTTAEPPTTVLTPTVPTITTPPPTFPPETIVPETTSTEETTTETTEPATTAVETGQTEPASAPETPPG